MNPFLIKQRLLNWGPQTRWVGFRVSMNLLKLYAKFYMGVYVYFLGGRARVFTRFSEKSVI